MNKKIEIALNHLLDLDACELGELLETLPTLQLTSLLIIGMGVVHDEIEQSNSGWNK